MGLNSTSPSPLSRDREIVGGTAIEVDTRIERRASSTVTPAVFAGRQVEWFVSILALGSLLVAGLAGRSKRR